MQVEETHATGGLAATLAQEVARVAQLANEYYAARAEARRGYHGSITGRAARAPARARPPSGAERPPFAKLRGERRACGSAALVPGATVDSSCAGAPCWVSLPTPRLVQAADAAAPLRFASWGIGGRRIAPP